MQIKKCVGAILYDDQNRIFLMTSPNWKGYVIPAGEIEKGEDEETALRREIGEELNIEISNLVKIREKHKKASSDFKDPNLNFYFIDYFAKALQTKITPNEEVSEYGWYFLDEALKLPLIDSTRELVNKFKEHLKSVALE
jgi:8-oxo-dGTP diphosphatase